MRTGHKRFIKGVTLLAATVAVVYAFSSGPPPGRTGGFGDTTCQDCHQFGADPSGSLTINGVPDPYTPGQDYPITVTLGMPGQQRWGFQLAARFQGDGSQTAGSQAGLITVTDPDNTQIKTVVNGCDPTMDPTCVQFIEHTSTGTYLGTMDGPVSWTFTWTAPSDPTSGTVEFDAAGNAANGDGTPLGDYIYTTSATSGAPSMGPKAAPRR